MTDDGVTFLFQKLDALTATGERTELIVKDVQVQQVSLRSAFERLEGRLGHHETRIEALETKLGDK